MFSYTDICIGNVANSGFMIRLVATCCA